MKPLTVTRFGVERHSLVYQGDHPDLLLHFRVGSQSHLEFAYVSNALLSCNVEGFHCWSGSHLPNLSAILKLLPAEISRRQGASIEIVFGPF